MLSCCVAMKLGIPMECDGWGKVLWSQSAQLPDCKCSVSGSPANRYDSGTGWARAGSPRNRYDDSMVLTGLEGASWRGRLVIEKFT